MFAAPKTSDIQLRTCVVEWNTCKPIGNDPIIYRVQVARLRDQDYRQVDCFTINLLYLGYTCCYNIICYCLA